MRVLILAAVGLAAGTSLWAEQPQLQVNPVRHTDVAAGGVGAGGGHDGYPAQGVPASFTLLPGLVTPVKDQGPCGSCWAFATYGSMESSILKTGGPVTDLSENNLKNRHGFDYGPCDGGHEWMSMAYLSRLSGPLSEAYDPYHPWDDRATAPVNGPRKYFLKEATFSDTSAEMKQALMDSGALSTSMHWDSGAYDAATYTYRYTGAAVGNHAVTIVGWDDNKAVPGASAPGAWQIKNSWGASWGQNGYFWISYEDTKGAKYGVSFQAAPPDTVKRVLCHDYYGDVTEVNCPYGLNVFRTTQVEELKAVGFYTEQDDANYLIRIYDTLIGSVPAGLLATKSGTASNWGFHVVNLDSLVSLGANDDFVVCLYIEDGGPYPQAIDFRVDGYNSFSTANPGESYYSFDGIEWTDITTFDATANFSIKAYTVPEPATLTVLAFGAAACLARRRSRRARAQRRRRACPGRSCGGRGGQPGEPFMPG